jgi:hypothetical protein
MRATLARLQAGLTNLWPPTAASSCHGRRNFLTCARPREIIIATGRRECRENHSGVKLRDNDELSSPHVNSWPEVPCPSVKPFQASPFQENLAYHNQLSAE